MPRFVVSPYDPPLRSAMSLPEVTFIAWPALSTMFTSAVREMSAPELWLIGPPALVLLPPPTVFASDALM